MSVDIEAKDIARMFLDVFYGRRKFDAACFASSTGVDLGFHHYGCA